MEISTNPQMKIISGILMSQSKKMNRKKNLKVMEMTCNLNLNHSILNLLPSNLIMEQYQIPSPTINPTTSLTSNQTISLMLSQNLINLRIKNSRELKLLNKFLIMPTKNYWLLREITVLYPNFWLERKFIEKITWYLMTNHLSVKL